MVKTIAVTEEEYEVIMQAKKLVLLKGTKRLGLAKPSCKKWENLTNGYIATLGANMIIDKLTDGH